MRPLYKFGFSTITGLSILLATTVPVAAESLSATVQQQDEVQKVQNKMESLQNSISRLSADIDKKQNDLDTIKAESEKIQATIKEKEKEARKEESLKELSKKLETTITNLHETEDQLKQQEAASLFIAEQSDDSFLKITSW